MSDTYDRNGMQAVYDRLTRLEEQGVARNERDAARNERMARLEGIIGKMDEKLDALADDVKAAKTGLRVGMWLSATVVPTVAGAIGWFAHLFAGK